METEINEVKNSIYAGMSIYRKLENLKIKLTTKYLTKEEKKYLSLYLGIINTNNKIGNAFKKINKKLNIEVNFKDLETKEYLNIYKNNFTEILINVDFESIDKYIEFLLSQDIVKELNKINNIKIDEIMEKSNKQLLKK